MDTLEKLEEIFRHFPGIGPRQAKRFAYYLLTRNDSELRDMAELVLELKKHVAICARCQRYFHIKNVDTVSADADSGANTNTSTISGPQKYICSICKDPNRQQDVLMIVSRDIDMQAMERSRAYNGLYFVLGGSVPILDENPAGKIRQAELIERIKSDLVGKQKDSQNVETAPLKEIILATSVNPEGEHTAEYLTSLLKKSGLLAGNGTSPAVKISTLGRGLSTGTELEYSDSETLKSALQNRR